MRVRRERPVVREGNVSKRQTNTGERLLRSGLDLLSQEGMSGVTLGRLAESVGISKSGVFAHFSSKVDVQLALLDYSTQFVAPIVLEPAMQTPAGLARVRTLIEHWFGWAPRAGLPGGCPIAAAMFELDDVESPVRDKVAQMEAEWRGMLCQFVTEAKQTGELRADLDVEQFVWELCGIYLGHHVTTRFVRDPSADRRANTAVQALLTRSLPTAS
jgi:AcrR family transcriptional regulator